jgi:hypothetical protein
MSVVVSISAEDEEPEVFKYEYKDFTIEIHSGKDLKEKSDDVQLISNAQMVFLFINKEDSTAEAIKLCNTRIDKYLKYQSKYRE